MENTVMENIQLRSEQELDDVNITIQAHVHHALELTQENAPNNMSEDTTVVPQMNEDGNSVSHGMTVTEKQETVVCEIKEDAKSLGAKEKESKCVMEKGNNDLTVMEKDDIIMNEKGMAKQNKDVCEIKEDTKFVRIKGKGKGFCVCDGRRKK